MAKSNIEVLSNLESVGDMVGALVGMSEGIEEREYIETIIKEAHSKASDAFDVSAAATASTGRLRHVYEFGTAGITAGPVKFPDPTDAKARLWVHTITGSGGQQDIGFSFRPALNRNPQPTTKSTGVPSKYLRKLSKRKYVFWNKAFVMETGMSVEIRAKNSDYLFVPFNNDQPKNPLNKRGFVMYNTSKLGPIESTPGKKTKGTFGAFWVRWWAGPGSEIIEMEMRKKVVADLEMAQAAADKSASTAKMKPVQATNLGSATARGKAAVKRIFDRRKM